MLSRKLRAIYGPFVLVSIGTLAVYTVLDWLLVFRTEWVTVDEEVVKFWLPFSVPWLTVFVWLRPRIKTLKLAGANGKLPFLYASVAALAIAIPTIIAQEYI